VTTREQSPRARRVLVFTDLDGTLLDTVTYSNEAALPALQALKQRRIPLVIVSSKTRTELESIRRQLDNHEPFVTENGGGVFIPPGTFKFPLAGAILRDAYQVIEHGTPYRQLRLALADIARAAGCELKGFGDMTVEEVVLLTRLSPPQAALAKQREYDEPFVLLEAERRSGSGSADEAITRVYAEAERRGLRCISGGRFHHLHGLHDKGQACRLLIQFYRQHLGDDRLLTIALGDSQNDHGMLAESDHPVLVRKCDGSYAGGGEIPNLPNLIRADGIGPIGWNRAILGLLRDRVTDV